MRPYLLVKGGQYHRETQLSTKCVFGSAFVELILDRIDFVRIDLGRIDFEIK